MTILIYNRRAKLDIDLDARINVLCEMNDRRDQYITQQNRNGLLTLADEYRSKGMKNMAKEIEKEASRI